MPPLDSLQSDATLLLASDLDEPRTLRLRAGAVAVYTHRSPQRTTENEDAACVLPLGPDVVLAVADGLGGHSGGSRASSLAMTVLRDGLAGMESGDESGRRGAILDAIELANKQVSDLNIGAGTTLAMVEIASRTIRPFHVGDSAILVVGQRGKVKLLTVAHSPVGYALEAGLIDEHEALHHRDRHIVSNIVGSPRMRIDIGSAMDLRPRDTVLLATDGLFDNLMLPEIVDTIRKGPLHKAALSLAVLARRRMQEQEPGAPCKPDDLTFVLYRPAP